MATAFAGLEVNDVLNFAVDQGYVIINSDNARILLRRGNSVVALYHSRKLEKLEVLTFLRRAELQSADLQNWLISQ